MQLLAGITQFFAPSSPPPSNETHQPNPTDSSSSIEGHDHENAEVSDKKSNANTESLSSNVRRQSSLLSRGNRTLGGTSNMRRREEDSSDEKRLFPTYNKTNKDVPIVPGQSVINNTRRNPIARFGPRPFDGITSRGKDSGPVRAYGSSSATVHNNKYSANSRHPLSPRVSLDDRFGPSRRQRRLSGAIIDLVTGEDNKQTAPKSVYRGRSPSVASVEAIEEPQTPTEPGFARNSRVNKSKVNESSKSQHSSEIFIEDAQIKVDGIEDQNYATQPTFPHKKRRLDRSESPDELQGNVDFRTNSRPSKPYRSIFKPELPSDDKRPKLIKGRKRLSSPNDIQPTVFNSSNKTFPRTNNRQNRPAASHKYLFEITLFRYDNIYWENRSAQLYFDEQSETFGLFSSGPTNPTAEIAVRRILKVLQGADESLKCRFNLSKTESSIYQHKVDVEFANSAERDRLCDLLKKKNSIIFQEKSKDWMDKAFQRAVELEPPREAQTSRIDNQILVESGNSVPIKRQKLSSSLQGENESLPGIKQPPRRFPLATMLPDTRKTPERNDEDEGVTIPVKTYRTPRKDWATRSKTRQSLVDLVENEPESPKAVRTSGGIWSKPLVYPPVGKKKAEVNSYDLTRLRDGEFLNDNLIGLYARFLEHYLERNNPEIARRVYFFNSYFYATLTNPGKGQKGINYQGVMKWTRNVDLFNHDYIIVPINENAHWYLAIICNLTVLKKRCQASDEQESKGKTTEIEETAQKEIPETPTSGDATTAGETARESLEMMKLDDVDVPSSDPREAPRSDNEWPEHEENHTTAATILDSTCGIGVGQSDKPEVHSAKKKKPKSSGPVYAVDQPTIITFDSLNESRANTIKILKQYLLEESGKAGLTFEPKDIKGMTAKGIPLQPNYSDCGLYLLAYLEKFVQDPDTFVRTLLRREMKTQTDWPTLQSGLLRRRLRIFLHRLYREQESGRETSLLVDVEPISYLLDPSSAGPLRSPKGVEAVTTDVVFVPDSFEEKEKGLDETKSEVGVQSVVEETQFSQQSSEVGGQHEPTPADKPEPKEDHVEDLVALLATPDRAVSADAKEPGSPAHQPDRVAETIEVTHDSDSKAQESVDIFDEIRDYIIQASPPCRTIEIEVPTVQVPRTPPSNKTSKTLNALRKGRPKEPL